ncbi:unnamed protein product, partial [Ectocarpus sp. 12 AP-2014]
TGEEKEDSDDAGTHREMHPARKRRREDSDEKEDDGDVEDSDEEAERDKDAVREMHEA